MNIILTGKLRMPALCEESIELDGECLENLIDDYDGKKVKITIEVIE